MATHRNTPSGWLAKDLMRLNNPLNLVLKEDTFASNVANVLPGTTAAPSTWFTLADYWSNEEGHNISNMGDAWGAGKHFFQTGVNDAMDNVVWEYVGPAVASYYGGKYSGAAAGFVGAKLAGRSDRQATSNAALHLAIGSTMKSGGYTSTGENSVAQISQRGGVTQMGTSGSFLTSAGKTIVSGYNKAKRDGNSGVDANEFSWMTGRIGDQMNPDGALAGVGTQMAMQRQFAKNMKELAAKDQMNKARMSAASAVAAARPVRDEPRSTDAEAPSIEPAPLPELATDTRPPYGEPMDSGRQDSSLGYQKTDLQGAIQEGVDDTAMIDQVMRSYADINDLPSSNWILTPDMQLAVFNQERDIDKAADAKLAAARKADPKIQPRLIKYADGSGAIKDLRTGRDITVFPVGSFPDTREAGKDEKGLTPLQRVKTTRELGQLSQMLDAGMHKTKDGTAPGLMRSDIGKYNATAVSVYHPMLYGITEEDNAYKALWTGDSAEWEEIVKLYDHDPSRIMEALAMLQADWVIGKDGKVTAADQSRELGFMLIPLEEGKQKVKK